MSPNHKSKDKTPPKKIVRTKMILKIIPLPFLAFTKNEIAKTKKIAMTDTARIYQILTGGEDTPRATRHLLILKAT